MTSTSPSESMYSQREVQDTDEAESEHLAHSSLQSHAHNHSHRSSTQIHADTLEPRLRLRKACDGCSARKVKCDESGPPCKSCAALDLTCTFNRPSRRRGPVNRHIEALRRERLQANPVNSLPAPSPRIALLPDKPPTPLAPLCLSADLICDIEILQILIDDYFTYIHPVIPLPHEPTFRAAWARRDDRIDRGITALLAAMIEVLVASFPRRPRQLFTSAQARGQFPNAGALIDRCHQVFTDARGSGFTDRVSNLNDALCSYLAGLAAGYVFDMARQRRYLGECVMMLRTLGFHRPETPLRHPSDILGPTNTIDHVYQQSGLRLFWLCFVGTMSMRQLGGYDADVLMPPTSRTETFPCLPFEVDDEYIYPSVVLEQPIGVVSALTGFNHNVRIFRAFHSLVALEIVFGADTVYDWDRQRQLVRRALADVKNSTKDIPQELRLTSTNDFGEWPPASTNSLESLDLLGREESSIYPIGAPPSTYGRRPLPVSQQPKRAVQFEIQKANIYATQLATRSYLVEKFWNLYEVHERELPPLSPHHLDRLPTTTSPTAACVVSGIESRNREMYANRAPSDSQMDFGEQAMAVEREDIIRDMALLLENTNQVNMEPNGLSFCNKIRQVASTLLSQDRSRMAVMPTLDADSVNEYLYGFCNILAKLERLGPGRLRGVAQDGGTWTMSEAEEEELIHWASLKEHHERFVRSEGFLANV